MRYELRRGGRPLKVEKIPMDLLILLATSEGKLVTREEIEGHLWGKEVFVDAEHGINTAIRKVRQVLGDDTEEPRFVQTVQKKGYRFIAEVKRVGSTRSEENGRNGAEAVATASEARKEGEGQVPQRFWPKNNRWVWVGVASAMALLAWPTAKFLAPKMTSANRKVAAIRS